MRITAEYNYKWLQLSPKSHNLSFIGMQFWSTSYKLIYTHFKAVTGELMKFMAEMFQSVVYQVTDRSMSNLIMKSTWYGRSSSPGPPPKIFTVIVVRKKPWIIPSLLYIHRFPMPLPRWPWAVGQTSSERFLLMNRYLQLWPLWCSTMGGDRLP